jgi:hypothetical protein
MLDHSWAGGAGHDGSLAEERYAFVAHSRTTSAYFYRDHKLNRIGKIRGDCICDTAGPSRVLCANLSQSKPPRHSGREEGLVASPQGWKQMGHLSLTKSIYSRNWEPEVVDAAAFSVLSATSSPQASLLVLARGRDVVPYGQRRGRGALAQLCASLNHS